ncbi:MAG TPA: trypsin-like peptidase domain-containing protein, partial [Rugosimonospora sp.]|nr:trypsin-like peptidase domain-containing protein [Rugosimonospora sp.]
KALEQRAAASLDSAAVASAVLPSVFRVDAGNFSGTAFAVGKAGGAGTDLLTNFHVVADLYGTGGRSVALRHDNQRFPARIVRVDQARDLALLHATQTFPRLAAAGQQVASGAPIIVVGAPLGLAQSVSSGIVSAVRSDVPGEAGKTYIQFSAPINPGNSGGPVVDAQKQVVGIATAKATNAEGIGLAIPIHVACDSFPVC